MALNDKQHEVLDHLRRGLSLRQIANLKDGMPSPSTVMDWVRDDPKGFGVQYARARNIGLDELADRLLEVAGDKTRDSGCRRVEVDALKWYLSKMAPKRYGDRMQQQEISGPGRRTLQLVFVPAGAELSGSTLKALPEPEPVDPEPAEPANSTEDHEFCNFGDGEQEAESYASDPDPGFCDFS